MFADRCMVAFAQPSATFSNSVCVLDPRRVEYFFPCLSAALTSCGELDAVRTRVQLAGTASLLPAPADGCNERELVGHYRAQRRKSPGDPHERESSKTIRHAYKQLPRRERAREREGARERGSERERSSERAEPHSAGWASQRGK